MTVVALAYCVKKKSSLFNYIYFIFFLFYLILMLKFLHTVEICTERQRFPVYSRVQC